MDNILKFKMTPVDDGILNYYPVEVELDTKRGVLYVGLKIPNSVAKEGSLDITVTEFKYSFCKEESLK